MTDDGVVTSARPLRELLDRRFAPLSMPDGELMEVVSRRIGCQIAGFVRSGAFPLDDAIDGAEMYRALFMRLWLRVYGTTLIKYGSHDHAIVMCAHRGLLEEITREALRLTGSTLRWR